MALGMYLPRPLARDGEPVGASTEADDVRTNRRDCRRPNLQLARKPGRRPELGLPLYVDPRFRVHLVRSPADWIHERGCAIHAIPGRALSRASPRWFASSDVRHRWAARFDRTGFGPSGGLQGIKAGANRQ